MYTCLKSTNACYRDKGYDLNGCSSLKAGALPLYGHSPTNIKCGQHLLCVLAEKRATKFWDAMLPAHPSHTPCKFTLKVYATL